MPNYYPDLKKILRNAFGTCFGRFMPTSKNSEIKPTLFRRIKIHNNFCCTIVFRVSQKLQVVMLNQRHSFLKGCVYFKSKYIIMLWKSRSLIFWKWDKSENHSYPRMSKVSRNTKNNSMDIWQRLLCTYKRVSKTMTDVKRWTFEGSATTKKIQTRNH